MSSRIEARPTDGLSYNPNEAKYWERAKLDKEIERVFDICHGCRLCFNLCPSFPALFEAVDAKGDDVRNLTRRGKSARHRPLLGMPVVRGQMPLHATRRPRIPARFPRTGSARAGDRCARTWR